MATYSGGDSTYNIYLARNGNIVTMSMYYVGSLTAGTDNYLGSFPDGYVPNMGIYGSFVGAASGTVTSYGRVYVKPTTKQIVAIPNISTYTECYFSMSWYTTDDFPES